MFTYPKARLSSPLPIPPPNPLNLARTTPHQLRSLGNTLPPCPQRDNLLMHRLIRLPPTILPRVLGDLDPRSCRRQAVREPVFTLGGLVQGGADGSRARSLPGPSVENFVRTKFFRVAFIRLARLRCRSSGDSGAAFRPAAGFGGLGRGELKVISCRRR